MDESPGGKHLQIRISQEEHRRLTELAGKSLQGFVRTLIQRAIEPTTAQESQQKWRREHQELHRKLEDILNSGDESIIGAIVPNIEVFLRSA